MRQTIRLDPAEVDVLLAVADRLVVADQTTGTALLPDPAPGRRARQVSHRIAALCRHQLVTAPADTDASPAYELTPLGRQAVEYLRTQQDDAGAEPAGPMTTAGVRPGAARRNRSRS